MSVLKGILQQYKHDGGLSSPEDFDLSVWDLFCQCVAKSEYAPYFESVNCLLDFAEASVTAPKMQSAILAQLAGVSIDDYAQVVHLLHTTMFVRRCLERANDTDASQSMTPVTDALSGLFQTHDIGTVLKAIPDTITDVLTAHPVDMDRGLVVTHKQRFEALSDEWQQAKSAYALLSDSDDKVALRARMNDIHRRLKNRIVLLLNTPNYRAVQIKPESEQRHLSRSIKLYEAPIVSHWQKLVGVVQEVCLTHMGEHAERYFEYQDVLALPEKLRYKVETWRGDMDGNPNVDATTMAMAMAYGRKRSFERLSADDAVIRYRLGTPAFLKLESEISDALDNLLESGQPAWQAYIQQQRDASWEPVQIYSGLAYYRLVEMTEAAEQFLRVKQPFELLQAGFESESDFLAFTAPLQAIEQEAGIVSGVWCTCRERVNVRGLALGLPHVRKGEAYHVRLMDDHCRLFCPNIFGEPGFSGASAEDKRTFLNDMLEGCLECPTPQVLQARLVEFGESQGLLQNYLNMMLLAPDARLIQSDSGSELGDAALSLALLKAVSVLIGHRGSVVLLFEDEPSMISAIDLMNREGDSGRFDRVIMMCAGSDNQKKMGPFYSSYLNRLFLKTAAKHGVSAFFGVGDSPLRSSTHDPFCAFKTFQPGSRKTHFFGNRVYRYLSERLANQISESGDMHAPDGECDAIYAMFARAMYAAYRKHIGENSALPEAIKRIADIATTYFSRPAKKGNSPGALLEQIRAIDSGRAQLILNTFDPQLAGLRDGVADFLLQAKEAGISKKRTYRFFNTHSSGKAMLDTLAYFATMLDDDLVVPSEIRSVTESDIKWAYHQLSGRRLRSQTDAQLRLARLVWWHMHTQKAPEQAKARALLLFGANWMV